MSHTPGPWTINSSPYDDGTPYFIIKANEGFYPEGFGIHTIMGESDARLIAAAPELLEALKIIADWDKAPLTGEHRDSLLDVIRSICDCARRTIAKAEGGKL